MVVIVMERNQKLLLLLRDKVNNLLRAFTGYEVDDLNSFEKVIQFLYSPRDGSSLAIARIFYGICMMIDTVEERAGSELDERWGDENDCRFTLLPFVQPLSLHRMGLLYGIMWLGALGICVGFKFTLSCCLFAVPYWYLILLDKSVWNNHSYLFGLVAILFACSSANRCFSLDRFFENQDSGRRSSDETGQSIRPTRNADDENMDTVPFWNYFIIKFQYYILYTLAGIYKLSPEWLSGYAMTNLGNHWVFTPFRVVLGTALTDLLIIHWFGCLFDLTIAFWLTFKRTRVLATLFAASFHWMNSRLFTIGMFPWLCLVHLPLFYADDWPRRLMARVRRRSKSGGDAKGEDEIQDLQGENEEEQKRTKMTTTKKMEIKSNHKRTVLLLCVYMFLQLLLPNSHFITRGYNNWTKGLYGYSWNMMINSWQPYLTSVKVVDNVHNKTLYLKPDSFTENSRWTRHADMAKQFSHCIHRNIQRSTKSSSNAQQNHHHHSSSESDGNPSADNISIYFDIWCSMNSRFQQRVFDPRVDILTAEWSPWRDTPWLLPILHEFSDWRPRLAEITQHVLSWNNHSDVLFIADFPGLSLDNYVAESAENVSLTVLHGAVRLSYEDSSAAAVANGSGFTASASDAAAALPPVTLAEGQSIPVLRQAFHNILVVSAGPASYMYTYTNATQRAEEGEGEGEGLEGEGSDSVAESHFSFLNSLWEEAKERRNKFQLFFQHVLDSVWHEIYGVPMILFHG